MKWDYLPGEIDAWSEFLKSKEPHAKFTFTCSRGHQLESPIELDQAQIDARCLGCEEDQ